MYTAYKLNNGNSILSHKEHLNNINEVNEFIIKYNNSLVINDITNKSYIALKHSSNNINTFQVRYIRTNNHVKIIAISQ
jgi:hypothetical protein